MAKNFPRDKGIAISIVLGFVVAFIALGLPMIGVTVNLYVGCASLVLALILLIYGFVKWEKVARWPEWVRVSTAWLFALIYVGLIGSQIYKQYKKDHPPTSVTSTPPTSPTPRELDNQQQAARTVEPVHRPAPQAKAFSSVVQHAPPLTYQQNCQGSACAQGTGSQATYNQYGPPKLAISDAQAAAIRDAMKPFSGIKITVAGHDPTPDSIDYIVMLCGALNDAGITVIGPTVGQFHLASGPVLPGITIWFSEDMAKAGLAFEKVFIDQHLAISPPHGGVVPDLPQGSLTVMIAPNR